MMISKSMKLSITTSIYLTILCHQMIQKMKILPMMIIMNQKVLLRLRRYELNFQMVNGGYIFFKRILLADHGKRLVKNGENMGREKPMIKKNWLKTYRLLVHIVRKTQTYYQIGNKINMTESCQDIYGKSIKSKELGLYFLY